ncbi:MAG: hypothetical protein VXY00_07900 [Candidatus Latescibacterota bacterium]|nr:hypothetical protein [Candidatus Latescibacterota bacterium]MEE2628262.1 hypothetical protein [Candidatus Latescibacterota bacterium]MEE2727084.1 hypothetical protein [Candidatus Latescibacterota bacterium]
MKSITRTGLLIMALLFFPVSSSAEVTLWKMGGSGMPWAGNDSAGVMIDFEASATSIQPKLVTSDSTVFIFLEDWSPKKNPDELGFVDGERPRAWKGCCGTSSTVDNALNLIDGTGLTYNPTTSNSIASEYYTIDLGVPIPLFRFAMRTPDAGFFRSDGTPLDQDAIPAYEVSIAPDTNNDVLNTSDPIGEIITEARENARPVIFADFPMQYVRYVRYKRLESILDVFANSEGTGGTARSGTVGEFSLYGEGMPMRANYKTTILEMDSVVNFGRLYWHITPMRMVDGVAVEDPEANVWAEVEARTGVDPVPDIYYEYTDMGTRVVVTQERYQNVLKNRTSNVTNSDGLGGSVTLSVRPKPGIRAGIESDTENWTFWSFPTTESGEQLNLNRGSHIQLKIVLHSERFDEFARLDSLWIETSPILATRVVGEIARLDMPQPVRGVAEVNLGEKTDFLYELKAEFSPGEPGFDALRIDTGSEKAEFKNISIDGVAVNPVRAEVEGSAIVIELENRVTRVRNPSIQVEFAAEVFDFARTFTGEVYNVGSTDLPQPVEGGDASEALSTNGLRVLASSAESLELVQDLTFSSAVVTPNGDGINDVLRIDYTLYGLPQSVPVNIELYALDGKRVALVGQGLQGSGPQEVRWDGRDERGDILPPGMYLLGVGIAAENKNDLQMRPVGVAY